MRICRLGTDHSFGLCLPVRLALSPTLITHTINLDDFQHYLSPPPLIISKKSKLESEKQGGQFTE